MSYMPFIGLLVAINLFFPQALKAYVVGYDVYVEMGLPNISPEQPETRLMAGTYFRPLSIPSVDGLYFYNNSNDWTSTISTESLQNNSNNIAYGFSYADNSKIYGTAIGGVSGAYSTDSIATANRSGYFSATANTSLTVTVPYTFDYSLYNNAGYDGHAGAIMKVALYLYDTDNYWVETAKKEIELEDYSGAANLLIMNNISITCQVEEGHRYYFQEWLNSQGYAVMRTEVPVPEPATMLLIGSGLIGLAGLRRKFKK